MEWRISMVDYSNIYNEYWQRPDRFGESSFEDPFPIARQILSTCGMGRILDIGCGMGRLVLELLKQGNDAYGVDISRVAVTYCNRFAPHRFFIGSVLDLPFQDNSIETLISTDCLEHISPDDILKALKEMHRICRRFLYLRIATGPDRDGIWHLIEKKRDWWENTAFEAGFRKHPAYYRINDFMSLEHDGYTVTIPLEKMSGSTLRQYPLTALHAERDLHMDMLRETGRRSDAHIHRYQIAAQYVRPGDIVLDAACGLGYGSHLLSSLSQAGRVIGVDISESAISYASACFSASDSRTRFHQGDIQNLSFLADRSIDLLVSFETLEHISNTVSFIEEAARILKPGGRFIISVPNRWVDKNDEDPSPWHLHVYDWKTLREQLSEHFLLEKAFGETAGGGMRLKDSSRDFFSFDPQMSPYRDCEWLLVVGFLDPLLGQGLPYTEQMYEHDEQPENLIAFSRDYINPYLPHSMVSIPWRISHPRLLQGLAEKVEQFYPDNTPDYAAAVCILAYRIMEDAESDSVAIDDILHKIHKIHSIPPSNPHYFRWQISTAYIAGLLSQKMGAQDQAVSWFERCAAFDCRTFSPTLATKTVGAAWHAGQMLAIRGNIESAINILNRGIEIFFEIFKDSRRSFLGQSDRPFDFPFFELTEVVTTVTNCVNLLRSLSSRSENMSITLPVENLQATINALHKEMIQIQANYSQMVKEVNSHWSIRIIRKIYNFIKRYKRAS